MTGDLASIINRLGAMKCSRTVHGFGYGGDRGFAADVNLPNFDWAKLKARLPGISDSAIALPALYPRRK